MEEQIKEKGGGQRKRGMDGEWEVGETGGEGSSGNGEREGIFFYLSIHDSYIRFFTSK